MKMNFKSPAHRDFFFDMMARCKKDDCYHRAFFYLMGVTDDTRKNIHQLFDFKEDCIEPDGLNGRWQTGGTVKLCSLAFNLWNGCYIADASCTPYDLFCSELAPWLFEGIKIRYPEYCFGVQFERGNEIEQ